MKGRYLRYIPKTLQEDFIDNRVIPFIGAGFSNAGILPDKSTLPDWEKLGRKAASYIRKYSYTNAIDAFSLFESEYSRTRLIELLAKELKINQLKPSNAHRALCDLYFDTICTTNYDCLIEQALNEKSIPFSTILSEERLPINMREKTKLIKLHGDFNHPEKMVITENDYDTFLDNNKVLSTYVSNLFITKTLLLIGYSFNDNDIRTLWQIIENRLGQLHTPAYAILVEATPLEVARLERHNIKAINIRGNRADYADILFELFTDIKGLIETKMPNQMVLTNEKATEELRIPREDNSLCYISAPLQRLSFLKALLYPVLQANGISPITLDEAIIPDELLTRKIDTILNKSSMAIIDMSGDSTHPMWEFENALSKGIKVFLIAEEEQAHNLPPFFMGHTYYEYYLSDDNTEFLDSLNQFLADLREEREIADSLGEHFRLLSKGEYAAAIIIAFRLLETTLLDKYWNEIKPTTYTNVINSLNVNSPAEHALIRKMRDFRKIRNIIVHSDTKLTKRTATKTVKGIADLCKTLNEGDYFLD